MLLRILQAKYKFAYHLETRGPDSLAGMIWLLEKQGMLNSSLYSELAKAEVDHAISLPSRAVTKEENGRAVAAAVHRAAPQAVRYAMRKCSKLVPLHRQTRSGADCNSWFKLKEIRLVVRAKLSCLTQFQADFCSQTQCECECANQLQLQQITWNGGTHTPHSPLY